VSDPTDVHVGKRLRMRRVMLKLSQGDLGKPCGVSFQQIQKYEKGFNRVSASRLQQFAKLLDVPVSFFFEGLESNGGRKKNQPEDLATQLLSTRLGVELSKAFMAIEDRAMRRAIVNLVEQIANQ
jgi:transcriptional regulator with XRE-family HTH domain